MTQAKFKTEGTVFVITFPGSDKNELALLDQIHVRRRMYAVRFGGSVCQ